MGSNRNDAEPFWTRYSTGDAMRVATNGGDAQFSRDFLDVLDEVTYKSGYGLLLAKDKTDSAGRWYFQVECARPDIVTGEIEIGRGGKAYLSPHMNVSELTRVVFGLFLAYEEHEAREFFRWRDRAIFGPHISSEALWEVATRMDYRAAAAEDAGDAGADEVEAPVEGRTYWVTTRRGYEFAAKYVLAPGIDYFWDPVWKGMKHNGLIDPVVAWSEQ